MAAMTGLTHYVTSVTVLGYGVLRLTFADGTTGEIYVLDRTHGPVFERAITPEGFAEAHVDSETGTVCWSGGADLAPDTLYLRVMTGVWPAEGQIA